MTVLLTIDEACNELRIGRSLLLQKVYAGEIPSVRVGKRRLVPSAGLQEYVNRLSEQSGGDDGA